MPQTNIVSAHTALLVEI